MFLHLHLLLIHPDPAMSAAWRHAFTGLPRVTILQSTYEQMPPHDCFVTAGNSYGIMTAGIDAAVIRKFGPDLMQRVQFKILNDYLGEQPIGSAFLIPTGDPASPWLCHAPTMRTPSSITGTDKIYLSTWASLLAIYQHNAANLAPAITTVGFPAMGTGFGNVPFPEAARQMAAAYRHYLSPPHRLDWDEVIRRERAITYDGATRMVQ